MLVPLGRDVIARKAFVGQYPTLAVLANAQDRSTRAQSVLRRVVEHVPLKGARRQQRKAEGNNLLLKRGAILNHELDLYFDRTHTAV